jgi:general stress protein 26
MTPADLLAFLRTHKLAVVATVGAGGAPEAAVVGAVVTDSFELFFDTTSASRKIRNLRTNPRVAAVIGGTTLRDERTVQLEGVADEPSGDELARLKEEYFSIYPDGRDRQAWPEIAYVRVRPAWVRYSDFNLAPPQIVEWSSAQLLGD